MKVKLKHTEEGVVLVSDQPLFDQLGDGTELEVSPNGTSFVLTPVADDRLIQILDEMDEQYGSVFRRLAQ
ncbi:MAG TPA: hypothetical protein VF432_00555 [Thermoanaerobaculia bacterium]